MYKQQKSSLLVQARSALKKLSEHTDSLWTYCSYISKALPAVSLLLVFEIDYTKKSLKQQPEGGCALFKIIEGPTDEEATILPDIACARCVSTYPSTSTGKVFILYQKISYNEKSKVTLFAIGFKYTFMKEEELSFVFIGSLISYHERHS